MEPQIRYVKSADGASIATATLGADPLLVLTPMGALSSIESSYAVPEMRRQFERIAERYSLVTYDHRGAG